MPALLFPASVSDADIVFTNEISKNRQNNFQYI